MRKSVSRYACESRGSHLNFFFLLPVGIPPINRRQNIFFMITSPTPGTFVIALHFKGRDKPILEMDLKIDDLLEKVNEAVGFFSLPHE